MTSEWKTWERGLKFNGEYEMRRVLVDGRLVGLTLVDEFMDPVFRIGLGTFGHELTVQRLEPIAVEYRIGRQVKPFHRLQIRYSSRVNAEADLAEMKLGDEWAVIEVDPYDAGE